jgi:hypothetical protein
MINYFYSPEAERLKEMIANKTAFLQKQTTAGNKPAAQFLQREIMFLQNELLPLVLQNANICHWELAKYVIQGFETGIRYKCNGVIMYLPISENYTDHPTVGILNTKQDLPFRTPGAMQVYCNEIEIINMDGNGAKIKPLCLTLNDLLV